MPTPEQRPQWLIGPTPEQKLQWLKTHITEKKPHEYMHWYNLMHAFGYYTPECALHLATMCNDSSALRSMMGHLGLYESREQQKENILIAIASNKVVSDSTLAEIFYYEGKLILSTATLKAIAKSANSTRALNYVFSSVERIPAGEEAVGIITEMKNNPLFEKYSEAGKARVEALLAEKQHAPDAPARTLKVR